MESKARAEVWQGGAESNQAPAELLTMPRPDLHTPPSFFEHAELAPSSLKSPPQDAGVEALVLGRTPRAGGQEAERMFDTLRNAVLDQRLPPGMQLKEQALADAFKVNRALVRAVLARLESARLVEHRPNRGVFVATPTVAEARDIFAARRVIEAALVRTLTAVATPAGLAEMQALVEREQAAYRSGDLRAGLRLSVEFHRLLARLAGNSVLGNFLEELVARTPLVVLSYKGSDTASCALDEHSAIVEAIAVGDAERAVTLMDAHLNHLEARLESGFRAASGEADIAAMLGLAPAR